MTEQQRNAHQGPIKTHRMNETFVKIWENETKEGRLFYNVTVGRTYTDQESGEVRDTNGLTPTQMNKLPLLINHANHTISLLNDRKAENEQALDALQDAPAPEQAETETGLKAQRDAVLAKAKSPSIQPDQAVPAPSHSPQL